MNKEDARGVAEAYAPDARTFSIGGEGFEPTAQGRDAIAKDQSSMIEKFALHFELERVLLRDGVGLVEWQARGTYRANSIPVHLRGGQVLRFSDDGHIATEHSYSDTASVAIQVGLLSGRVREATPLRGTTDWVIPPAGARDAELVARVRSMWTDPAALAAALADDVVLDEVALPFEAKGKREALEVLGTYRTAMPDLAIRIEDAWAFGDVVVMTTVLSGTQTGPLQGLEASGKRLALHLLDVVETRGDRVVRIRRYANRLEWLTEMGLVK